MKIESHPYLKLILQGLKRQKAYLLTKPADSEFKDILNCNDLIQAIEEELQKNDNPKTQ